MNSVFTVGVFDLFHVGHLRLLQRASQYGNYLIVGIVKDEAIQKQKGINRPIISFQHRKEILEIVPCVNKIVELEDFNPTSTLEKLTSLFEIQTFVKGEDQNHIDTSCLERLGIKLVTLERTSDISTSDIIKKMQ